MAYCLALPPNLSMVHPVFHVSMLRKYVPDPSHVIASQDIQLDQDLSYEEEPVAILDRQVKQFHSKEVPLVKVLWRSQTLEEATWESEEIMRRRYPHLFSE